MIPSARDERRALALLQRRGREGQWEGSEPASCWKVRCSVRCHAHQTLGVVGREAGFAVWISQCQRRPPASVPETEAERACIAIMKRALDKLWLSQASLIWDRPSKPISGLHHYWFVQEALIHKGPTAELEQTPQAEATCLLECWTPPGRKLSLLRPQASILPEANKGTQSVTLGHTFPCTVRRKGLTPKFCCFGKSIVSISKLQYTLDFIFPFQFLKAISPPTVNHETVFHGVQWVISWA